MIHLLYENGAVLVAAKPAGLSTQAPTGIDSLERRARHFLQARQTEDWAAYLAMPHRLDRPVSGALLLATRKGAARKLSQQFERRQVRKIYWAITPASGLPASGNWRDVIKKRANEARAEVAAEDDPQGAVALLSYQLLAEEAGQSLVQIELSSGRYHQIRLQFALRGLSILGDELYGSCEPFGPQYADPRSRAIALHARELGFFHPQAKEHVTVKAPLPDYWRRTVFADFFANVGG